MARSYEKSNIILTLNALQTTRKLSISRATRIYKVLYIILRNRYYRIPLQHDIQPKSRKLTNLEELVIIRHILDLDSWLFPPRIRYIKDIANYILSERGKEYISKN